MALQADLTLDFFSLVMYLLAGEGHCWRMAIMSAAKIWKLTLIQSDIRKITSIHSKDYHFDQVFAACDLWPPRREAQLFGRRQAAWQDENLFEIAVFGRILGLKAPKISCHCLQKVAWPVTKRQTLRFGQPCDMWPKSWSNLWYSSKGSQHWYL